MDKSVFTRAYKHFRSLLVEARRSAGLTQSQVAELLGKPQSFVSKYELGERRLDIVEFLEIANALGKDPYEVIHNLQSRSKGTRKLLLGGDVLDRWSISARDLTELVDQNPSLRGILLGYIAEFKLEQLFSKHTDITSCTKYDDHDRRKKGDRLITWQGDDFVVEVKSLQTNSVKKQGKKWIGKVQVDASDRREVTLPDRSKITTTCLVTGEFDLLAVNLFAFEEKWRFAFAKNSDLPRSRYRKYTTKQQQWLLATLVKVTWPPEPPFYEEPFGLLREIARGR